MPMSEKRFINPTQLTTSASTSLYTVPSGMSAIIKQVVVTNVSGNAATFTLYIGSESSGNELISAMSVAANDTVIINLSQVLNSSDILRAKASVNSAINLTVSGVENDGPISPYTVALAPSSITTNKIADGAVTTAKIENNSITTEKIAVGAVVTADIANNTVTQSKLSTDISLSGMRNAIINGDFSIDQRNNGNPQTITAGAALAYTLDRWYAYCTGANISVRRQLASLPLRYRYLMSGSSGNTGAFLGQRIEAANSYHFAGKTATLSVYTQSSTITSVNWAVYRGNSTDFFGTVASPFRTLIASGTMSVSSTMSLQSTSFDVPSDATTGLEVVFSVPSLGGLDNLFFGNVQLEVGVQRTPFEQRPTGLELLLCQRYYFKIQEGNFNRLGVVPGDPTHREAPIHFPVQMRSSPTVTVTGGSVFIFSTYTLQSASTTLIFGTTTRACYQRSTGFPSATTGATCAFDAFLIEASAELIS